MGVTTSAALELAAILRSGAGPVARAFVENGGAMRVSELAEVLGRHRGDSSLQSALLQVAGEGYYKLEGETSARRVVRERPLRIARVCPKCGSREFGELAWVCPVHGSAVDQPNQPYGVSVVG
jgi:hypothetical protein